MVFSNDSNRQHVLTSSHSTRMMRTNLQSRLSANSPLKTYDNTQSQYLGTFSPNQCLSRGASIVINKSIKQGANGYPTKDQLSPLKTPDNLTAMSTRLSLKGSQSTKEMDFFAKQISDQQKPRLFKIQQDLKPSRNSLVPTAKSPTWVEEMYLKPQQFPHSKLQNHQQLKSSQQGPNSLQNDYMMNGLGKSRGFKRSQSNGEQHFFRTVGHLKQKDEDVLEQISSILQLSENSFGPDYLINNKVVDSDPQDETLHQQIEYMQKHRKLLPSQCMKGCFNCINDCSTNNITRKGDQNSVSTLFHYVEEDQKANRKSTRPYQDDQSTDRKSLAKEIYHTRAKKSINGPESKVKDLYTLQLIKSVSQKLLASAKPGSNERNRNNVYGQEPLKGTNALLSTGTGTAFTTKSNTASHCYFPQKAASRSVQTFNQHLNMCQTQASMAVTPRNQALKSNYHMSSPKIFDYNQNGKKLNKQHKNTSFLNNMKMVQKKGGDKTFTVEAEESSQNVCAK